MVDGLAQVQGQAGLTAVVNTGDDGDFYGLRVCPDLDICTYVLAGGMLEDGDIMQMRHDLPQIVGVVASPESDGAGLLRVVLLA